MNIGNLVTGQTIIEAPDTEEMYISDSELISYYMNYVIKDKFKDTSSANIEKSVKIDFINSGTYKNYSKNLINNIKEKNYSLSVEDEDNFKIKKVN